MTLRSITHALIISLLWCWTFIELRSLVEWGYNSLNVIINIDTCLQIIVKNCSICKITFFPDARLTLYGSSRNGFGNAKSDVDICMTFDGVEWIDVSRNMF